MSSENNLSLKDSISPYFGEPEKALAFFTSNYPSTLYSRSPNDKNSVEAILRTKIFELMLARNYKKDTIGGMDENDVHNEFVDFIVRTASLHKELDATTSTNKVLVMLTKSFDESIQNFIRADVSNYLQNATPIVSELIVDEIGNPNMYIMLCAVIFNIATELNNNEFKDNQSLKNFCDAHNITTYVKDMWKKHWDGTDSSASKNVNTLIDEFKKRTNADDAKCDAIKKEMSDNIENGFFNIFVKFAIFMFGRTNMTLESVKQMRERDSNNVLKTNDFGNLYKKVIDDEKLLNTFTKNFESVVGESIKKFMSNLELKNYTEINNDNYSYNFCRDVLGNWSKLDKQAREFYRHHIGVFRKNKKTSATDEKHSGWSDHNLIENAYEMDKINCDSDHLRLNLMRENRGSTQMMFSHTLPFLPVKHVGKLWYTDVSGSIQSIANNNLSIDTLKKIYDEVYRSHKKEVRITLGKQQMNVCSLYENYEETNLPWSLNFSSMVKNIVTATIESASNTDEEKVIELYDIDTGVTWHRDANGLFRVVDSKKIYYDPSSYDCTNSLSLNQHKMSPYHCEELATCILSTPDKLPECFKKLENYDMFEVAREDLKNMNPVIAKALLKVFCVNVVKAPNPSDPMGLQIIRPMTYSDWYQKVLLGEKIPRGWTQEFKSSLAKNEKLLKYINGVIDFVRYNPVILNDDLKSNYNGEDENIDPQVEKLRKVNDKFGVYVHPISGGDSQTERRLNYQTATSETFQVSQRIDSGHHMSPFVNAFIGGGGMNNHILNTMGGGGFQSENKSNYFITNLGKELMGLFDDVSKLGLSFDKRTIASTKEMIRSVGEVEHRMNEMIKILKVLKNLEEFVAINSTSKRTKSTSKDVNILNVLNDAQLLSWLEEQIRDYQTSIGTNNQNNQATIQKIIEVYGETINYIDANGKKKYAAIDGKYN